MDGWILYKIRKTCDRQRFLPRSAKKSDELLSTNNTVFGPNFFWGKAPKFWDLDYKTEEPSDRLAKFRGDRPTELGDLALKKKINICSKT